MSVMLGLTIGLSWGVGIGFAFGMWGMKSYIDGLLENNLDLEFRAKLFEEACWRAQKKLNKMISKDKKRRRK